LRLAAIDIGSNAARLLISEVSIDDDGTPRFMKLNLFRVPLRLGFDVFEKGEISDQKADALMNTIQAYRHLMKAYDVRHHRACATSAMRDASNSAEVIGNIQKETGVYIEVISGDMEASLIYENHIAENLDKEESYLYVDVGGGSTELTFFSDGRMVFKKSFNIGTIRLLKGLVTQEQWTEMKDFIREHTRGHRHVTAIGSGGNINKVFSLSKRKEGKSLPLELLRDYHRELSSVGLEQRKKLYNMNTDRADVIVPALQIYINVMRWAECDDIHVPKIGLADGLIHHLYDEVMRY
jgi:exopolyphosphatase/guanosine-5'-triphosphate,3'-diphosphate pyrophosphatase